MQSDLIRTKLWEHILAHCYGTSDLTAVRRDHARVGVHDYDLEAVAFFSAIDAAFTPTGSEMQGCVPIHHELVQYLAGWCSSVARGSPQQGGPSTNHFLGRALNGFISTLYEAVWRGRIWRDSDNVSHFGCLKIPVWFILHCMDILQTQAEYENKMWDAQPSMRDYLRSEKPESY